MGEKRKNPSGQRRPEQTQQLLSAGKTPRPEKPKGKVNSVDRLSINKNFAERYEDSKRKQLLSNLPATLLDEVTGLESSSEEEEDEFGELLTKGIDRRVRETLEAIRRRDPKIYDKNTRFFQHPNGNEEKEGEEEDEHGNVGENHSSDESNDSDDEPVAGWDTIANAAGAETKKLTLKDYVRETLLEDGKLSDSEDENNDGVRYGDDDDFNGSSVGLGHRRWPEDDTKTNLNGGFVGKLNLVLSDDDKSNENNGGADDDSDEDFFQKKSKSAAEIEEEEKDFEVFLKKQGRKNSQRAGEDLLLHAYLENEKPDEKERFLRDFVLNNGWLNKKAEDAPLGNEYEIEIDTVDVEKLNEENKEDDEDDFEDKADEFEAQYNFRFEDPEGAKIVSHGRQIAGSIRRPDDRRKRAREARRLRKEHEKVAKTEDIKHLKNLKKREIQTRLLAIQEAAGDGVDLSGIDLEADFDPDRFNREMESKFGDDYYSVKDKEMKELEKKNLATASECPVEGKRTEEAPEEIREDVHRMMDEYYNLDYEDIVGGVPMRFNYKKVEPESFNMTTEDIIALEDKDLNKLVSMKYLAPYRANRDIKKQSWRVRDQLKKQRQSGMKNNENMYAVSEVQLLVKPDEELDKGQNNDKVHTQDKRGNKKRKKSSYEQHEKVQDTPQRNDKSERKSNGREAQEENGDEVVTKSKYGRKRDSRKKEKKQKTMDGLSDKRKEAYGIE